MISSLQLPGEEELRSVIMRVFILLSVLAAAFAYQECGENEHFESCGTACPLTCENYQNPPKACVLRCDIGCHCDKGYVRSADGRCVKPEECPARADECGENEHFESCGTACPLTCENYQNPPKACVLRCDIGCHCDKGYVRSADGRCVKPEECPARADECGENEHFESCGTACPLTCENYQNPPKACVLRCDIGCHCDKGYVRSADGRCVKPEECPARAGEICGPNEQWTECGTDCPLTCQNYRNPPKFCNLMCRIGCECKQGFVRSRDGRCVRPFNCPVDAPVEKSCTEKPESGLCDAYIEKFHYDAETGTCQKFIYGGCGGNGNRYDTEEECQQNCAGVGASLSSSVCDQPREVGVCRGFFPRYYFDLTTGRCQKFVYGGCGGNENNFETEEECNQKCGGARSAASLCELPAETGPCRARMGRYHFDKRVGTCRLFIYGGCGGNANNFETPEECMKACYH